MDRKNTLKLVSDGAYTLHSNQSTYRQIMPRLTTRPQKSETKKDALTENYY